MEIAFVRYLTQEEVLAVYQQEIGKSAKLLEEKNFDSVRLNAALKKAERTPENKDHDHYLIETSALYLFYLISDRPFQDGNKRTAVASAILFLQLNEVSWKEYKEELFHLSVSVTQGSCNLEQVILIFERLSFSPINSDP